MVFDENCKEIATSQTKLSSDSRPGGIVEQNPSEILDCAYKAMDNVAELLVQKNLIRADMSDLSSKIRAIGITNQRETTLVWDRHTGKPFYPAIVWNDSRCQGIVNQLASRSMGSSDTTQPQGKDVLRPKCGLPLVSYFSALKLVWIFQNVPEIPAACEEDRCMFGTVDSWLIWNMTNKEKHVTDVTNASRTMLLNLQTKQWDPELLEFFSISPKLRLPEIRSCAEDFGTIQQGPFRSIPITGCIGDQQSALVGQLCVNPGDTKNTYGTGCFLLCNTGQKPVFSSHGLLTTIGFQLGPDAPVYYALEGSVNTAGSAVSWLQDNLGLIQSAQELSVEAAKVPNSGGMYFVPAFAGLFAPYWREDARAVMVGMNAGIRKAHICRALLDAVGLQTNGVLNAMEKDSQQKLKRLRVDGGMTNSELFLQIQADVSGLEVERPAYIETTALGAAITAGIGAGVYSIETLQKNLSKESQIITPQITNKERESIHEHWENAIKCSLTWAE